MKPEKQGHNHSSKQACMHASTRAPMQACMLAQYASTPQSCWFVLVLSLSFLLSPFACPGQSCVASHNSGKQESKQAKSKQSPSILPCLALLASMHASSPPLCLSFPQSCWFPVAKPIRHNADPFAIHACLCHSSFLVLVILSPCACPVQSCVANQSAIADKQASKQKASNG